MSKTSIEWTDETWNPIRARTTNVAWPSGRLRVGWHCEHVSPGCEHCYAEAINGRRGTRLTFKPGHRQNGDIELFLDERTLTAPLRWRKPRMIFPCSMTDMFAAFVPDAWLDRMFTMMALTPHHTYQTLTKRPERMRRYVVDTDPSLPGLDVCTRVAVQMEVIGHHRSPADIRRDWPPKNIWWGTSVEDQARANERIPHLLATPAAVRFVSIEPLLGPLDLGNALYHTECCGNPTAEMGPSAPSGACCGQPNSKAGIDWVIVGGESGPGARPMHPDWARAIRDQCQKAGAAFFFKQWGEWIDWRAASIGCIANNTPQRQSYRGPYLGTLSAAGKPLFDGRSFQIHHPRHGGDAIFVKLGNKRAGRLLDGREWNEMPA